jgi:hypothetical protein
MFDKGLEAFKLVLANEEHHPRALDLVAQRAFVLGDHRDRILALYDGEIYVARFIRGVGDEPALVHWADGLLSEIYRTDILGPSDA